MNQSVTKNEEQNESPLDIAVEIQEALKPLAYQLTAFSNEGGEYTVKLKKYDANVLTMDGISESFKG